MDNRDFAQVLLIEATSLLECTQAEAYKSRNQDKNKSIAVLLTEAALLLNESINIKEVQIKKDSPLDKWDKKRREESDKADETTKNILKVFTKKQYFLHHQIHMFSFHSNLQVQNQNIKGILFHISNF